MVIEIQYPNEPAKTSIIVKELHHGGKLIKTVDVSLTKDNEILLNIYEERTALKKAVALPFRFTYRPDVGYAPIHEVMDARNDRIKDFYYKIWFGDEECPFDASVTSMVAALPLRVRPLTTSSTRLATQVKPLLTDLVRKSLPPWTSLSLLAGRLLPSPSSLAQSMATFSSWSIFPTDSA
jgi:enoyl reductase-like protein